MTDTDEKTTWLDHETIRLSEDEAARLEAQAGYLVLPLPSDGKGGYLLAGRCDSMDEAITQAVSRSHAQPATTFGVFKLARLIEASTTPPPSNQGDPHDR